MLMEIENAMFTNRPTTVLIWQRCRWKMLHMFYCYCQVRKGDQAWDVIPWKRLCGGNHRPLVNYPHKGKQCDAFYVPDGKVHGANMEPIWGRQDPDGSHVGPVNFAIWGYPENMLNKEWSVPRLETITNHVTSHLWKWFLNKDRFSCLKIICLRSECRPHYMKLSISLVV